MREISHEDDSLQKRFPDEASTDGLNVESEADDESTGGGSDCSENRDVGVAGSVVVVE